MICLCSQRGGLLGLLVEPKLGSVDRSFSSIQLTLILPLHFDFGLGDLQLGYILGFLFIFSCDVLKATQFIFYVRICL